MKPTITKKKALITLLEFAIERIKENDSYQGRISWDFDGCKFEEFKVDAAIRHGNLEGQGSTLIVQEES